MLTKPNIQAAIAAEREKLQAKFDMTKEHIAAELARCAFSNMQDYFAVGPTGDPYLDWSKLTRDQAAAFGELTVEDFVDGRRNRARVVRKVRFKLVDKRAALDSLARLLG